MDEEVSVNHKAAKLFRWAWARPGKEFHYRRGATFFVSTAPRISIGRLLSMRMLLDRTMALNRFVDLKSASDGYLSGTTMPFTYRSVKPMVALIKKEV